MDRCSDAKSPCGDEPQANDPLEVISDFVTVIRRLMETSGDLMSAIEAAAPFEPLAVEAWQEGLVIHRVGWGLAVEGLKVLGALGPTADTKAADILSFLSLPATWRTLSRDHGWTYDEVEAWIVETAMSLVIEPGSKPRTGAHRQRKGDQHTD